jgi:membrane protein implicated in regulation of membrane protease activity
MDAFTIYLICFGTGLVFSIVSGFLAGGSGGHEAHDGSTDGHPGDFGGGHDMPGFSPLSPTVIASFVTAFGGLGMIFSRLEFTSALWLSVPLALVGGLAVAASVFALFRSIYRATQASSEAHVSALIGSSATVISPIPAASVGEIAYVQGGSRYTAPAREEDGAALAAGQTVVITRIVGTQFYVRAAAYLP